MTTTEEIASAVMRGKRKEVGPLVQRALDEGVAAQAILDEGLIAPMGVIGDRFSAGEAFVPEMLVPPVPCPRVPRCSSRILPRRGLSPWVRLSSAR